MHFGVKNMQYIFWALMIATGAKFVAISADEIAYDQKAVVAQEMLDAALLYGFGYGIIACAVLAVVLSLIKLLA